MTISPHVFKQLTTKPKPMFKVYDICCKNCLLSENSIVSPKRRKEIISGCAQDQSHFICHKASMNDKDICCHKFYKTLGYVSQMIRIAGRLGAIEFVPQDDSKKLPTYKEMSKPKTKINK